MCFFISQGEKFFEAPQLSTIKTVEEPSIVEHFLFCLCHKNIYLHVPCEKEKLCDDASVVFMPQLVDKLDIVDLESKTYDKIDISPHYVCV
jgi:hypothetical protein